MVLYVDVANKIAIYPKRGGSIVCGNSDYKIKFNFDSEWDGKAKVARFIWNGQYEDADITDDICNVPVIRNTTTVNVGVYSGDFETTELKTTTGAVIGCELSILCNEATPSLENDQRYVNEAKEAADKAEAAAKIAEEAANRAELEGGGISAEVEERLGDLEKDVNDLKENGSEGIEKRVSELEKKLADISYEEITASLSVTPSTAEVGEEVKDAVLTWGVSKDTKSITLTLPTKKVVSVEEYTSYTDENSYTENKVWTLKATEADEKGMVATATASLTFYHRVYWGVGTQSSVFESVFVKSLGQSKLSNSKSASFTVTPETQYIYYAVPKDLCNTAPTFIIDKGFAGGFEYKEEITVTNEYDAEIVYYVYRSDQLLVGSTRVDVS